MAMHPCTGAFPLQNAPQEGVREGICRGLEPQAAVQLDHPPGQIVVGKDELHRLGQLRRRPRVPTGMACCMRAMASGLHRRRHVGGKDAGAMPITRMP